ncbi:unnamed protein product [Prorocentrum cordatum]|uniref:Uncharacterized protein n=1 Tax=Prorocentrum cordatum TaxID=2364126 RepID=A0ABN9Y8T7_9DINO|nr:unnamed protein product [Polarella glacialis]
MPWRASTSGACRGSQDRLGPDAARPPPPPGAVNAFDTPWSPHDNKGTDWKSYLTFLWKPLLQYIVFPAQFLFLYSYHPSGPMGDLPKRLEADWRKRHAESAEAAFKRAKERRADDRGALVLRQGQRMSRRQAVLSPSSCDLGPTSSVQ